jgi:streptogramin lyase
MAQSFTHRVRNRQVRAFMGALLVLVVGCSGQSASGGAPGSPGAAGASPAAASPAALSTPLPDGVLASIPLDRGVAPLAVAVGFGSVWVTSHRNTLLYRIDPGSNTVIARIDVGQKACGPLGVGLGKVWVSHCYDGERVVAVDPATNQVVGSFLGNSIIVAFDQLWSLGFRALNRIDPTTYTVTGSVRVPTGWPLVEGDGVLWVIDSNPLPGSGEYSGLISGIDPASMKVVRTLQVPVAGLSPWVAFAFGAIWLKPLNNNILLKIDPSTGKTNIIDVPNFEPLNQFGDMSIAADSSNIWMRISSKAVAQIDPNSGRVLRVYPADPYGGGGFVALGFGSLWVANFGMDSVWRDRIAA